MRHLVVCCDGTWNTPDQEKSGVPAPTNVRRLTTPWHQNATQPLRCAHSGPSTGGMLTGGAASEPPRAGPASARS